jgi:hypothetical protein
LVPIAEGTDRLALQTLSVAARLRGGE